MVDSGAFTALTMGISIDIDAYADWLIENRAGVSKAVTLDVIGDWKGTAANYEYLLSKLPDGYPLLPVWHSTSPTHELERLLSEYNYVAIGGVVGLGSRVNTFMQHMVRVHLMAREHGTLLHGLGVTSEAALHKLPWHTVDSSSWLSGSRYGRLRLRDTRMRVKTGRVGSPLKPEFARLVRQYGGIPEEVRDSGYGLKKSGNPDYARQYKWLQMAAARSGMLSEGIMRQRQDPEARLYLAVAVNIGVQCIVEGHKQGNPYS